MRNCGCENQFERVDVKDLWLDLKRILRVQLRELVNSIEDIEYLQKQNDLQLTARGHQSNVA